MQSKRILSSQRNRPSLRDRRDPTERRIDAQESLDTVLGVTSPHVSIYHRDTLLASGEEEQKAGTRARNRLKSASSQQYFQPSKTHVSHG